ncbi:MAG: hypothetical protein AABY53_07100 [Bdellovibrionota bacterium]
MLNYKVAGTLRHVAVFVFLFCFNSHAQINYKLSGQYRSTPAANNFLGTVAYDGLLWGNVDKQKPLYGFYKVGLVLGGSPTAAAFVEVAPIAPVIFKLQKSSTYRFTKSSTFDCANVYCFGVMDRTDFSVTAGAAYNNIVGLVSYLWRDIRTPSSTNLVVAEQELFTLVPGRHYYNEMSITAGYLFEDKKMLGAAYSAGEISDGRRRSNSVYGFYRWRWNDLDLTAGAGSYQTDQSFVGGNGVIFAIGKKFGESLSLF